MGSLNRQRSETKGIVFFAAASLIGLLLSGSVFPFLSEVKDFPVPDITMCVLCVAAAFIPDKKACILAVVFGFLLDLFVNEPTAFSPMVFLIGILLAIIAHTHFVRPGTLQIAVCAIPCLALRMLCDTAVYLVRFEETTIFEIITQVTMPALIINFSAMIAVSFILMQTARLFGIFTK